MGCPVFQKRALAYVRHKLSDEFSSGLTVVQSDTADVVFESWIARTTVPNTIEWSCTSILCGCNVHSKMKGKSPSPLLSVESCCFRRNIGSGLSLPSLEETSNAPNSKSPCPLSILARVTFPFEKSLARVAVVGPGASKWTRNRPEARSAFSVSDGRRTLNEITGCGVRVTVLKEETVIPRKEVVSAGPEGSVAVMMATG